MSFLSRALLWSCRSFYLQAKHVDLGPKAVLDHELIHLTFSALMHNDLAKQRTKSIPASHPKGFPLADFPTRGLAFLRTRQVQIRL
jgi:hypothetical protein